jgi:hypothetical protein
MIYLFTRLIGIIQKAGLLPRVADCHGADVCLRGDDPLGKLMACGSVNGFVGVLCHEPLVELRVHLCLERLIIPYI